MIADPSLWGLAGPAQEYYSKTKEKRKEEREPSNHGEQRGLTGRPGDNKLSASAWRKSFSTFSVGISIETSRISGL